MAGEAIFVVDPPGWQHAFHAWSGIVGRDMTRRTIKGTGLAIGTAPKPGSPPRNRTGLNYATGRLAATIHPEFGNTYGNEIEGRVVVGSPHGLFVHEGTGPHIIRPRKAGGRLVFFWLKVGRRVALPVVHHPGTRPVPFLAEHLGAMVT